MTLWILTILVLLFALAALFLLREPPKDSGVAFHGHLPGKALIVVFSDSPAKNTRRVALWIHEATGAPILPLEVKETYPSGYLRTVARARKELKGGIRPELTDESHADLAEYPVIFLGSPVWWGQGAPAVERFLEENDFLAGKTVIPFATHGGGGEARTFAHWKELCPNAHFLEGLSLRGTNSLERLAGRTIADRLPSHCIETWLNGLFPEEKRSPDAPQKLLP